MRILLSCNVDSTTTIQYGRHVRSSQSSLFHPPCPFRDRLKKTLRLIRDLSSGRSPPCAACTRLVPTLHRQGAPVTASTDTVAAAVGIVPRKTRLGREKGDIGQLPQYGYLDRLVLIKMNTVNMPSDPFHLARRVKNP